MSRLCRLCKDDQPIENFAKNKYSKDGLRTECKDCFNEQSRKSYYKYAEKRIRKTMEYRKTEKGKKVARAAIDKWQLNNSKKIEAHEAVKKALTSGLLKKKPCCECKNINSQAHHEDYDKPLDIVWYCTKHHGERHREINDEIREKNRLQSNIDSKRA